MSTIDEKRVYGDRAGASRLYVASGAGLLSVSVAGSIGGFGIRERCRARDVASGGGRLAVATDDAVLLADRGVGDGEAGFEEAGFGPATCVGFDDEEPIAAAPGGRIGRLRASGWETLGTGDVRAISGDLIATAEGVCRIQGKGLEPVGLADVRDVSAAGIPLAATGDGLYALGNSWLRSAEGTFDAVGADPESEPGSLARANAASGRRVYEHTDGDWHDRGDAPGRVVGFAYGERVYAVTEDGRFLAGKGDGEWWSHPLGVEDIGGIALPDPSRGDGTAEGGA